MTALREGKSLDDTYCQMLRMIASIHTISHHPFQTLHLATTISLLQMHIGTSTIFAGELAHRVWFDVLGFTDVLLDAVLLISHAKTWPPRTARPLAVCFSRLFCMVTNTIYFVLKLCLYLLSSLGFYVGKQCDVSRAQLSLQIAASSAQLYD